MATKLKDVSKKKWRTEFIPKWVDGRKTLNLLSLGIGGSVTEKIDGQFFAVKMEENNKILIRTNRTEFDYVSSEDGHNALLEVLKTDMFLNMMKFKKMYGSFEFEGEIIYAPQDWYDEDGTITLVATKYHRSRMGLLGCIVIRSIKTTKQMSDIEVEDALLSLRLFFNINSHVGFKCYLNEEFTPTEDNNTVVDIPKDYKIEELPEFFNKLAENSKSMLNGRLDVSGCEVEGYVFYSNLKQYAIINKKWRELKETYLFDYNRAIDFFNNCDKTDNQSLYNWIVDYCNKFLENKNVPKGVRNIRKRRFEYLLSKACSSNSVDVGDYIKMYGKLSVVK